MPKSISAISQASFTERKATTALISSSEAYFLNDITVLSGCLSLRIQPFLCYTFLINAESIIICLLVLISWNSKSRPQNWTLHLLTWNQTKIGVGLYSSKLLFLISVLERIHYILSHILKCTVYIDLPLAFAP